MFFIHLFIWIRMDSSVCKTIEAPNNFEWHEALWSGLVEASNLHYTPLHGQSLRLHLPPRPRRPAIPCWPPCRWHHFLPWINLTTPFHHKSHRHFTTNVTAKFPQILPSIFAGILWHPIDKGPVVHTVLVKGPVKLHPLRNKSTLRQVLDVSADGP